MNTTLLLSAKTGFAILTVICAWLLLRLLKSGIDKSPWTDQTKTRIHTGILISLVLWLVAVSAWSISGIMPDFSIFPLNMMPVLMIPMIAIVISLFTKSLGTLLENVSQPQIIRLQCFRLFVELLLWALFVAQELPVQMTFEGRNFDVLVGLSAPLIAWLASNNKISKTGLIIWNFAGLAILTNIVTIAMLSTPTPIRIFFNEPANTIVAYFPVSWLPGFLVPLAYVLHLYSLKKLFQKKSA